MKCYRKFKVGARKLYLEMLKEPHRHS